MLGFPPTDSEPCKTGTTTMSNSMNRGEDRIDTQKSSVKTPGSGRVAIVTGAGRGLGWAMALGLAGAGIRVVATAARERAEIETVANEAAEGMVRPVLAGVTRVR